MLSRDEKLTQATVEHAAMLKDYLYVDEQRLCSYAEQIGASMATEKRPQWKVALGLTGPSVEGQQSSTTRVATDHERIQAVITHLKKARSVQLSRPASEDAALNMDCPFVLETMKARKVIFTCDPKLSPRGLREIVVWVSNPTESPSTRKMDIDNVSDPVGMFVYLLQGYWEDEPVQRASSMVTALNELLSALAEEAVPKQGGWTEDDGTRDDFRSAVSILERHGGVKGDYRNIESLYRIRSVSNNRVVNIGGKTLRCNDMFGYPVYVAAV